MHKRIFGAIVLTMAAALSAQEAPMTALRPDQLAFLALYKELVETNTTLSAGSCTLAAARMAAHLKAAGYSDADITLFSVPEHPKEGGLVAILHGTSSTAKPMLLLGHLDVVEAKREDWVRDPFTLIEDNGYYYARGTSDMKAMDATWVDAIQAERLPSHAHDQVGADLWRRDKLRFQRRGLVGKEQAGADLCGIRPKRRRRRAHGRSRKAGCGVDPGWRKGDAELSVGDR
jgi:hypothetical protein